AAYGWTIRRSDDDRNTLCQVSVSEPVGEAMDAVVNGVQRTVVQAARQVAAGIAQLQQTGRADCPASSPDAGAAPISGTPAMKAERREGPATEAPARTRPRR